MPKSTRMIQRRWRSLPACGANRHSRDWQRGQRNEQLGSCSGDVSGLGTQPFRLCRRRSRSGRDELLQQLLGITCTAQTIWLGFDFFGLGSFSLLSSAALADRADCPHWQQHGRLKPEACLALGRRRDRQDDLRGDLPILPDLKPIDDHQERFWCAVLSCI